MPEKKAIAIITENKNMTMLYTEEEYQVGGQYNGLEIINVLIFLRIMCLHFMKS